MANVVLIEEGNSTYVIGAFDSAADAQSYADGVKHGGGKATASVSELYDTNSQVSAKYHPDPWESRGA